MARTGLNWQRIRPWVAFAVASGYGAALWGSAPMWAGRKEPWDGSFGLYMVVVTLAGLFALIAPRRPLAAPAGVVVGQISWQLITGGGSLWPISMALLSVLAVPAAGVAGIVWLVDPVLHPRPKAGACAACGYDRKGLGARACPECGAAAGSAKPSVGAA